MAEDTRPTPPVAVVNTTQSRPNTSIGELFGELSNQITSLIRGEIELTKLKATSTVKKAGLGAGLLAGGAVFGLFMLGWIFRTIEKAIALALPEWAAALIVVGILLVITLILVLVGIQALKKGMAEKPDPSTNLKLDVAAAKMGLDKK
ncbi:phage holin family protein [Gleimia hominis]|uniref:Phage holin family protein n=1 Tax=Gleimia hominis TaxID=595468 RepID=A0ABU3I976_9ACTO|nr:phage holin family protein [Gleimia hominis]MDT3766491.1 phage holin family protein [Gleimia hominis]